MSIGPTGIPASTAGLPPVQSKQAEIDRTEAQLGADRRQGYYEKKAESASGVGQPDGDDHEAAERDGDGRRLWKEHGELQSRDKSRNTRQSKDPSQQRGNLLDLTG